MAQLAARRRGIWIAAVAVVGTAAVALYAGAYDVAADTPHWSFTSAVLEFVRERSIRARTADIVVPNLADAALISEGAEHYRAMCEGCHLAPGRADSELRLGLYPQPPNLAAADHGSEHAHPARPPAQQFWIIKHGLKMTAMPAWGRSHDDAAIWGLVALVRQLPGMTPAQYAELTSTSSSEAHEHDGGSGEHAAEHTHADQEPVARDAQPADAHDEAGPPHS